jgi:tetratricopeptide (TPR) repeat protein
VLHIKPIVRTLASAVWLKLLRALSLSHTHTLQEAAFAAYANRDFRAATDALTAILQRDGANPRWWEMRAQVLVDGKNFEAALSDFQATLQRLPESELTARARIIAGRALAHEGLSQWEEALQDYSNAMELAHQGG